MATDDAPKGLKAHAKAALGFAKMVKGAVVALGLTLVSYGAMAWLISYGLAHAFHAHIGWFGLAVLIYFTALLGKVTLPTLTEAVANGYHKSLRLHEAHKASDDLLAHLMKSFGSGSPADSTAERTGAYL